MALSNLQLSGALKRTQKGDADWYYGGDDEAWANLAAAKAGVPSGLRPGKTVGVFVSGKVVEYWWPDPAHIADGDLIVKTPDLSGKADIAYVDTQDAAEATARSAADTTLQTNIDTEAATRAANDTATLNSAKSYADGLIVSVYKDCGNWDASTGSFPTTGGTGSAGAIKAGNAFEVSVAGSVGSQAFDVGDVIRALIDTPGQTSANWAVSEHNTQQATESNRGTVKIADQTTTQNENTTNDTDAVTPKKFWFGWARIKQLAATITGLWNFTGGLQSGGNTVETQNNKDASGGYAGLTLFKINFKNAANTFTSFFTNANTASRTYTFKDRNGTILDDTDAATFVDKTTAQSIAGAKTLTDLLSILMASPEFRLVTSADSKYAALVRSTVNNILSFSNNVLQQGGVGNAIDFGTVGASGYFTGSDTGLPSGSAVNMTISFWVNMISGTTTGNKIGVLAYGSGANQLGVHIYNGTINLTIGGSSTFLIQTQGSNLANSAWHNVILSITGSTAKVYIDNTQVFSGSLLTTYNIVLSGSFVGGNQVAGAYNFSFGKYDQILIYNRALSRTSGAGSSDEIAAIYNSGGATSSPPTSGLVRRFDFEEGTGTTSADTNPTLGTQYNLTLVPSYNWAGPGNGIVPISGGGSTTTFLQSRDGVNAGERGQLWVGEPQTGERLIGLTIKHIINNYITYINDAAGNHLFSNNNTSETAVAKSVLGILGNLAVGASYSTGNAAPTNGALFQGRVILGGTVDDLSSILQLYGNLNLSQAGNKLKIATGTNASVGQATLVAGTVTVNTTAVAASSIIFLSRKTKGGTIGALDYTIVAGTSFTVNSDSASDTSVINYWILN